MSNQGNISNVISLNKAKICVVSNEDPDPSSPGALAMPLPAPEKEQEGDKCVLIRRAA